MTDADVIAYLRTQSVAPLLAAARIIRHRGEGGSRRGMCAWGAEHGPDVGLVRCVVPGAEPDDGLWVAYYGGTPLGDTGRAPVLLAAAWALVEQAAAADGYVWDVGRAV